MIKRDIEQLYKIDENKLNLYYERVKNQFPSHSQEEIIVRFLINNSIGSSIKYLTSFLKIYEKKLKKGKNLINLAFEWIRAQEIRLSYKKYLVRANYPEDDYDLAVDDCIFKFFLDYDDYLRAKLFNDNIKEHEMSLLFHHFFTNFSENVEEFEELKLKYASYSPTLFLGNKRISTRINTLRTGLSSTIKVDYLNVLNSRKEQNFIKKEPLPKKIDKRVFAREFNGSLLERLIKSYCIAKTEILENEIEKAVAQFLTGYFKFGTFYELTEFELLMKECLIRDIYSGLTENYKNMYQKEFLLKDLDFHLKEFKEKESIKKLDGIAWKNDLQPILSSVVLNFLKKLSRD
ncbi:MAG: hypothetical protein ACTSXH_01185 [Promethearchaeota archaeon]